MLLTALFLVGTGIGSFLNVLIYRIPRGIGFVASRSQCVHCQTKLRWYELIPFFSFVVLKGRCSVCGGVISLQYPLVEMYAGVMTVLSFVLIGSQGVDLWIFSLFLIFLFLVLGVIDIQHFILPDTLMIAMLGGAVVYSILERGGVVQGYTLFQVNNLFIALVLSALFFVIWYVTKGRGMGFGDVKLVGALGLIFGVFGGTVIVYVAVALAVFVGLLLILAGKATRKSHLPFGTFLAISATAYILALENVPLWVAYIFL